MLCHHFGIVWIVMQQHLLTCSKKRCDSGGIQGMSSACWLVTFNGTSRSFTQLSSFPFWHNPPDISPLLADSGAHWPVRGLQLGHIPRSPANQNTGNCFQKAQRPTLLAWWTCACKAEKINFLVKMVTDEWYRDLLTCVYLYCCYCRTWTPKLLA